MCGVVGLIFERNRADFGQIAGELLRTLEYRGYDSTGAAIQGEGDSVDLRKDVGAPSNLVHRLGITSLPGQILCGQVRWATFGAVDAVNAQPHVVRCKTYMYGAHNGNVTNCDPLKAWLIAQGHDVKSDNDGEMVVHAVEHGFAARLEVASPAQRKDPEVRRKLMRGAILEAASRLHGSYAAVLVDPISRTLWAVKQGSSLYFGTGADSTGGQFRVASSDLSSVLKLTRTLVPLGEGEFAEFTATYHQVYRIAHHAERPDDAVPIDRKSVRSFLRTADTGLVAPFTTFMQQEIFAEEDTCRSVVRLFSGGSRLAHSLAPLMDQLGAEPKAQLRKAIADLFEATSDVALRGVLERLHRLPVAQGLVASLAAQLGGMDRHDQALCSAEQGLLADLLALAGSAAQRQSVRLIDGILEHDEAVAYGRAVEELTQRCAQAVANHRRIFVLCCGTSFHAAKTAALFYNEIAGCEITPLLPGEFRAQAARSLRDGDVVIAVSQSGETKDLIDVLNDIIRGGRDVSRVAVVNNVNSTLAQEKSHLVLPLRCGPEIAVAATKSFTNQLAVFYCLALRLGEVLAQQKGDAGVHIDLEMLAERRHLLPELPELIRTTLATTNTGLDAAAEILYLVPSLHILATRLVAVAKEGALKVREVVLNHTEGFEASEFKHGPNTILGVNTVYGIAQVSRALEAAAKLAADMGEVEAQQGVARQVSRELAHMLHTGDARTVDRSSIFQALYADYPLLFVTGPDPRDVDLTISQINTHKIRGATCVVLAEEDARLRQAATKPPADNPNYTALVVPLPTTGDTLMTAFTASVALQHLALKMSLRKMAYLDALGMRDHGVHPDVPKNVSKSITVD
ncbi:MAG: SIS domain-containing protein [Deltaproteobacteria bacterium]|nr:SIS domain-containing protein [Deltaproteobacteria bacterium]